MTIPETKFTIFEHYSGKVKIKFYEKTHRYQKVGEKTYLIGASTATGMLDKSSALLTWASKLTEALLIEKLQQGESITEELVKMAVWLHKERKEAGATSGSAVHDWIESYAKGENPTVPEDEKVRNGVLAFLKWVKENDVKFLFSEKPVYSMEYNYVGKMDMAFTCMINPCSKVVENHKIIHSGDWKTSSGFYLSQAMQLAGYEQAEREEHGTNYGSGFIIRLDKETGAFESKEFSREEMDMFFEGFLDCLGLKNISKHWEKSHGFYSNK